MSKTTLRKLTKEEILAINILERLSKKWPKSLWLFSASGSLHVMMNDDESGDRHRLSNGAVDPDYVVTTITNISNDGGDW